jgi:hypothetical protein
MTTPEENQCPRCAELQAEIKRLLAEREKIKRAVLENLDLGEKVIATAVQYEARPGGRRSPVLESSGEYARLLERAYARMFGGE